MKKSKLELEFRTVEGKKFNISLDDPKEDITEEEIGIVMEDIITRNIFMPTGGDVESKVGARFITTTVQELTV